MNGLSFGGQSPKHNYLIFNGVATMSPDSLPAYEQMMIGGATNVRGYSEALIFGDRGFNVTAEHRWPIPFLGKVSPWAADRIQGVTFFDIGQMWRDNSTAGGVSNTARDTLLMGTGVGVRAGLTQYMEGYADFGYGLFARSEPLAQPTVRLHFGVRSNLIPTVYKKWKNSKA